MASSPSSVLMLGMGPVTSGLLITLGFGTGGTAPIPPPTPTGPNQSGVRNRGRGRRRWALRLHGKLYYFDDLRSLEAFANQPPEPDKPVSKKKAKPKLVVPLETIREAKEAGFDGLQKMAERMDIAALMRIEARMSTEDDEDFNDFISWLRDIDG